MNEINCKSLSFLGDKILMDGKVVKCENCDKNAVNVINNKFYCGEHIPKEEV